GAAGVRVAARQTVGLSLGHRRVNGLRRLSDLPLFHHDVGLVDRVDCPRRDRDSADVVRMAPGRARFSARIKQNSDTHMFRYRSLLSLPLTRLLLPYQCARSRTSMSVMMSRGCPRDS